MPSPARIWVSTLTLLLSASAAFAQSNKTPRPLTPFDFVLPDGQKMNLANYKGKVCVVEFLFTTCPHCQQTAAVMRELNRELGPKGFQPIGVAFNDGAMMLVPDFVKNTGANYPVGIAARDNVISYLGYSVTARLMVPQVIIVDKKGMIRYQSSMDGSDHLHEPARLRQIVTELLAEPATSGTSKKAGASTSKK